jgi:hypothetical protein
MLISCQKEKKMTMYTSNDADRANKRREAWVLVTERRKELHGEEMAIAALGGRK